MKITIAAVQMVSENHDFEGNLSRAESHIAEAVNQGANLILFPEFALAGYLYSDDFWHMAEPLKGRTYQWQKNLSEKLNVYIGNCILEKTENNFYDTFILTGPNKDDLWTHRKIEAPSLESFFFKGAGLNSCVFNTPIGKIGVAICFDSAKNHTVSNLETGCADIVLLAYSYPKLPHVVGQKDRNTWVDVYRKAPELYASRLQVPIVAANKTGRFQSTIHLTSPAPFGIGDYTSEFTGYSAIIDKTGQVLKRMPEHGSGVLVSEVDIGRKNGFKQNDKHHDQGWFLPYSLKLKLLIELNRKIGTIRYRFSNKRKRCFSRAVQKIQPA